MTHKPLFTRDIPNKQLTVVREFDAPLNLVWQAWTDRAILDQWWAPKPWKTETQSMDFNVGGLWLYTMAGPNGERHYSRVEYLAIKPEVSVSSVCVFCDEEGRAITGAPVMNWVQQFRANDHGTTVTVVLSFPSDADFETILKMGFQEGFTMGMSNLDEYLSKRPEVILP